MVDVDHLHIRWTAAAIPLFLVVNSCFCRGFVINWTEDTRILSEDFGISASDYVTMSMVTDNADGDASHQRQRSPCTTSTATESG